ncbi:transcription factor bHLH143-like [Argentina anserina]|uniref:transcription factor bHLH143-like n=1 Tax=Argentina anserina TaxID=57926 RepID=UPI00217622A3|nr:transcription factor bHLH143-like [Potentilla anserina]
MGEDFGSWMPQLPCWRPPDPYSFGAPFALGQQNFSSAYRNPGTSMLFTNGTLPVYASSGLPHPQVHRRNEPHGWFYCLPSFQQGFMPATHTVLGEKFSTFSFQNPKVTLAPCVDPDSKQKKLLVSNPSGDQTSLAFNSGIVNPLQCPTSWYRYQEGRYHVNGNDHACNRDFPNLSGAILTNEFQGNHESGDQSEMHEDTEELNALLYSDNESDYSEDDEVTSTGHSPSTMTILEKRNWSEARDEEVASSCGITKKRKLFDGGYDVPSVMDTASSKKPNRVADLEDDADSSCACSRSSGSRESDSESSNKMKKDKIRETVSILQDIIPGVKGKDAMVVLDEAILYLKSLKFKAKAFGLESL